MLRTETIGDLDPEAACVALGQVRTRLVQAEVAELVLAAHWADRTPASRSRTPAAPAAVGVGGRCAGASGADRSARPAGCRPPLNRLSREAD